MRAPHAELWFIGLAISLPGASHWTAPQAHSNSGPCAAEHNERPVTTRVGYDRSGTLPVNDAFICDAVRTPFGRYGGALATIRADDLAAIPLRALMQRNAGVDWAQVDDVIFGCANQAGEDNRNVARMALLLAGMPEAVPGTTVNRLCGSSLDAIAIGARAIKSGEADLVIAGGVESM